MAISTNTIVQADHSKPLNVVAEWVVNATSANASGGEILRGDPGANLALAVKYLLINCAADDTVAIREDTTTILGPFTFKVAASPFVIIELDRPIVLTANKELQVLTGGATAVAVLAKGMTIKTA